MFLPTVIVCCHGDAGIAQAGLLGEDHLWHSGHVDDVGTPLAEHQALSPRWEAGPLDCQHSPSHMALNPQGPRHLHQNLHQDRELVTISLRPVTEEGVDCWHSYDTFITISILLCWRNNNIFMDPFNCNLRFFLKPFIPLFNHLFQMTVLYHWKQWPASNAG